LGAGPIGPPTLPYQPLRLRAFVRNVSDSRTVVPSPVEFNLFFESRHVERQGKHYKEEGWPVRLQDWGEIRGTVRPADYHYMVRLGPKESLSASVAVIPMSVEEGRSSNDQDFLDHCHFWGPGQYELPVKYHAGIDQNNGQVELKTVLNLAIAEPRGSDKQVAEILMHDPKLALCLCESLRPPAPELVPKLKGLLKLYPKRADVSGLAHGDGQPNVVEREICGDSSYAYFVHFALARYYLKGQHSHPWEEAFALAAQELDHVVDQPFTYHPNALILAYAQSTTFGWPPPVPRSVWTQGRLEFIKQLLLDHYADTVEFLDQWPAIFGKEPPEWGPLPPGSRANWDKFRKTIPKPYPPPALVQASPHEAGAPVATNTSREPRGWANVLMFASLSMGVLLALGALVYSRARHRRNRNGT